MRETENFGHAADAANMPSSITAAEVCDATADASSNAVENKI